MVGMSAFRAHLGSDVIGLNNPRPTGSLSATLSLRDALPARSMGASPHRGRGPSRMPRVSKAQLCHWLFLLRFEALCCQLLIVNCSCVSGDGILAQFFKSHECSHVGTETILTAILSTRFVEDESHGMLLICCLGSGVRYLSSLSHNIVMKVLQVVVDIGSQYMTRAYLHPESFLLSDICNRLLGLGGRIKLKHEYRNSQCSFNYESYMAGSAQSHLPFPLPAQVYAQDRSSGTVGNS